MARITLDQIMEAVEADDNIGICIACGHEQEGVEPDARSYSCEACDARKVYGAEELLMLTGVTSPSAIEGLI
jgi:hypothetical protein